MERSGTGKERAVESVQAGGRREVRLVVGGMAHDFDFVRMELLRALGRDPRNRVAVSSGFEEFGGDTRTALISYTCNVEPSPEAAERLRRFVECGGRWLALHATNSLLEWSEEGVSGRPACGDFLETLGSSFQAHPPIAPYEVRPGPVADPLTAGVAPFTIEDELYLSDYAESEDGREIEVLLHARFGGAAPGFVRDDWPEGEQAVLYRRRLGAGEVLYFTPGHARGHYDAPHRTPFYPDVERGAWEEPAFREVLGRCLRWVCRQPVLEGEHA
ncbi:MAG: ThuA domain-containing protein [Erythrobacter sp.]